jgi:hypothetical protein
MNQIKAILIIFALYSSNTLAGEQLINQAKSVGIKSCLSTISDLENFFTKDKNYGSWSLWAKDKADDQIFNSTLEITFSDGAHLIDLTVAPTKDGQCSYSYTRTFYSEKSCMAFSKTEMKEAKYKMEVNKHVTAFEDVANWLLSSAGSGCMVQKKEVGIRHKAQTL